VWVTTQNNHNTEPAPMHLTKLCNMTSCIQCE
jgi:hypothetical protein